MTRPFRMLAIAFFVLLLASCGGGPGEADIRALISNELNSNNLGVRLGDVMEIGRVKIVNKAADGANGYIVDYEYTLRFKRGFRELKTLPPQLAVSLTLAMMAYGDIKEGGDIKAGDEGKTKTERVRLLNGSNGWMKAGK